MLPRRALALSCLAAALVVPAGGAVAQEQPPPPPPEEQPQPTEKTIAPGTKAGGVDVGGQTIDGAATTLALAFDPQFNRPIDVRAAGRTFTLQPARAKLKFDALTSAKRAYYAGRDLGPGQDVPLKVTVRVRSVRAFARRVDRAVSKAPRNARLKIGLRKMRIRKGRSGRTINEVSLERRLVLTLLDLSRVRMLESRTYPDRPDVDAAELRRQNGTVLTVDRRNFKLRLFKRLKRAKTYRIAIGAAGYDTPGGLFRIQSKQVNPTWYVPNSDWAGALAGTTVPGGAPNNPLKARWLGVNGSVGIHGTAEEWSIGSRASKGCIRMRVRDVIELYRRVPMGTQVLIR